MVSGSNWLRRRPREARFTLFVFDGTAWEAVDGGAFKAPLVARGQRAAAEWRVRSTEGLSSSEIDVLALGMEVPPRSAELRWHVVAVWSVALSSWQGLGHTDDKERAREFYERLRAVLPVTVRVIGVADCREATIAAALDALDAPFVGKDDFSRFDAVAGDVVGGVDGR